MRIPIASEGFPFIAAAALPTVALWILYLTVGGAVALGAALTFTALALALAAFFRDPERRSPQGSDLVLAPADGRVIDVATADEDSYLKSPARRVSVFLSLFDVHVNRYPVTGSVEHRKYEAGRFEPAWRRSASHSNERSSTGIMGNGIPILVRQIAGLAAKRIVTYARVGDEVRQGERMGLIRFGSRVDLFLPRDATLTVQVGQRVRGGVTIIARLAHGSEDLA